MLFWIFVIMLVIGMIVIYAVDNELGFGVGISFTLIGAIVSIIMLFIIIFQHVGVDAYIAQNEARYESLVYQYENDIYENDNDLGKRELMVDIQDWNEDLAHHQKAQYDPWIGIFYPNIYNQFEFIPLEK